LACLSEQLIGLLLFLLGVSQGSDHNDDLQPVRNEVDMTLYSLALFLHVGSALALASALSIDGLILFQLRRFTTAATVQPWLNLWSLVPRMAGGSGFLLLISGAYLTHRMSVWTLAWPKIALATLILIAVLGVITGKRMSALWQVCVLDETAEFECARRLHDPMLKVSFGTRIALLFAAVLLMNVQPGFWASLAIVGGSLLLGSIAALLIPRSGSDSLATHSFARG
jgi:hypothetical protein